jgi:hypothetical protein
MVAPRPLAQRKPALLPSLALATLGLLVLVALPTSADHAQTASSNGATYSIQFEHDGDNAWWVEAQARTFDGDSIFIMFAEVEGVSSGHYMKFAANDYERQQQGWSKFAPDQAFQVPAGKRVRFEAHLTDGATGQTGVVQSCWFTHPDGVEQCGSTTTFSAPFTGFRGNEWWVQAQVGTNGPAIAKVDVRIAPDGAWRPLAKQSWGTSPPSWAGSYHFPQGSILQMRATAVDGRTDLSSCRQWIPPAGTDATIVACPASQPPAFDATFSNVKGNEYWAEAVIKANGPIFAVLMKNCTTGEEEYDMVYRADWGKWTLGRHIPSGSKVYMTAIGEGGSDSSGTYIWPSATPSTPC